MAAILPVMNRAVRSLSEEQLKTTLEFIRSMFSYILDEAPEPALPEPEPELNET